MECTTTSSIPATILMVDNEAPIRQLFALVLEEAGYTVVTAPSGDTALAMLLTTPVHLVLTDHEMPGMCGNQLISTIRAKNLPVKTILASGHRDVAQLAAQCGADGYFNKGESIEQLIASVVAVLGTRGA